MCMGSRLHVCRLQYKIWTQGLGSFIMCNVPQHTSRPFLLRINDVIGCASVAFYVERGSQRSQ